MVRTYLNLRAEQLLSLRKGDRVLHYAFEGAPALTGPKTRRVSFSKPLRQLRTDGNPRNPVPPSARHALHLRIAQAAELVERRTAPPNQAFDHSYSSFLAIVKQPKSKPYHSRNLWAAGFCTTGQFPVDDPARKLIIRKRLLKGVLG